MSSSLVLILSGTASSSSPTGSFFCKMKQPKYQQLTRSISTFVTLHACCCKSLSPEIVYSAFLIITYCLLLTSEPHQKYFHSPSGRITCNQLGCDTTTHTPIHTHTDLLTEHITCLPMTANQQMECSKYIFYWNGRRDIGEV